MHQKLKKKYAAQSRPTGGPWLAHGRPTKKHIKKTLYAHQVRTRFFYTTLVGRVWAAGLYTSFKFNKYQDILIFYCILSQSKSKVTSCSYTPYLSGCSRFTPFFSRYIIHCFTIHVYCHGA